MRTKSNSCFTFSAVRSIALYLDSVYFPTTSSADNSPSTWPCILQCTHTTGSFLLTSYITGYRYYFPLCQVKIVQIKLVFTVNFLRTVTCLDHLHTPFFVNRSKTSQAVFYCFLPQLKSS